MPHIIGERAPTFELDGATFHGLAAPSRGARENAAWRVRLASGNRSSKHAIDREEIIIALGGSARFELPDASTDVKAGDAFIIPADTFFSIAVTSEAPFEAVAILPVGAHARFETGAPFVPPWAQ